MGINPVVRSKLHELVEAIAEYGSDELDVTDIELIDNLVETICEGLVGIQLADDNELGFVRLRKRA